MSDRNTIWIPCQECHGEKDENLVEVHIPDKVLNEENVEKAEDLDDDVIYGLIKDERIDPPLSCSPCGSDSETEYDDEDLLDLSEK